MKAPRHNLDRPEATPGVDTVQQHTLATSVALHLFPGVLAATAFYVTAPLLVDAGYPAIGAAILAAGIVIVGVELGWLLREAHRRTGSWRVGDVLPYRPGPFTWRKGLLALALLVWGVAVSMLGIGGSIKDSFFSWMPQWALDPLPASFADTGSSSAQILIAVGYLVFLVFLAPWVEELYFRGYLLPRISRFGAWSVLINVTLFASYHLWKPWDLVNLVLILAPTYYMVWRLKDIRIGIAVHIALNGLGWTLNVAPDLLLD
ncbi:CPBP family intramembrane glutamic endopeptidase [Kocuria aegyptia]|uniref:CAAX prenyl protease 2/Lysostaphin resistance protein A-like domain-containing protein n=1 Tax=Kocuria aegyptia TaxID=330943 RepID=A0ABN2K8R9_9MICC